MRSRRIISIFTACALLMLCALPCTGCQTKLTPDIAPHLIATPEANPVRPISEREQKPLSALPSELLSDAQFALRVKELYNIVVYDVAQPVFADNDPVEPVYRAALKVLDSIILNSWHDGDDGELYIVHSVHDWLATNVVYDFELYDRYRDNEASDDNPAFDISGVFLNHRAVCDGLSQAVTFMCAIEGVEARRVTGTFGNPPVTHAWNKVRVGGQWYNMDVTADMANYNIDGGEYHTQLSHGYFLISDATIANFKPNTHIVGDDGFNQSYPATRDYNYYADKQITVGDTKFNCTVRNADELSAALAAVKKSKRSMGKIELRLDFPEKTNVNDADMYRSEIAAAYKKLGATDFMFSGSSVPYFRFPNGVYLFLIYK